MRPSPFLLAAFLLSPALAAAQPAAPVLRLAYERGPGAERCPEESALRESVRLRLGRDPFAPDAPTLLTVTLARRGDALTGTLSWLDLRARRERRRSIRSRASRGCAELSRALTLAVALTIDPLALVRPAAPVPPAPPPTPTPPLAFAPPPALTPAPAQPPPAPASPPAPPPPSSTPPLAPARPSASAAPRVRWGLDALAGAAFGVAPGTNGSLARPAGGLALRLARGLLGARLSVRVEGPGSLVDRARQGAVSVTVLAVHLGLCALPSWRALRGELCAVAAVEPVVASGAGFTTASTATPYAVGLGAHASLGAQLGRYVALGLWGELLGLAVRPTLSVGGAGGGLLFDPAPVGGAAGLAVGVSIP